MDIRKLDLTGIEKISNDKTLVKPQVLKEQIMPSDNTKIETDKTKFNQISKGFIPQSNISFLPKLESVQDATVTKPIVKEEKSESVSGKLTDFGGKYINQPILDHYSSFGDKALYKPIIAQLDSAIKDGKSLKELEKTAVNETHKLYPNLSTAKTLAMAYESLTSSAIKNKYSDPTFFNGERDKIFHYCVSATMTLEGKSMTHLPKALTGFGVLAIGWAKEVASIPGNGYGADDMQANKAGINSALKNFDDFDKNKKL